VTGARTAPDVVVVGAGIVGAACAYYAARAGLSVAVVDRGPIAGGTTSAGEGNLLVSDKAPGPELELMLESLRLWRELAAAIGGEAIELEPKGGLVVAADAGRLPALRALAEPQRAAGVEAVELTPEELVRREPKLAPDLAGGLFYPQDLQIQPMLAAAQLIRASRAMLHCGAEVVGVLGDGRVTGVRLAGGDRIAAGAVVNAAGTWGGQVAALAGVRLPVAPRRGFILVTEPLGGRREPAPIRHKVYAADYMSTVASDEARLQASAVVESTRAGTILIGASRERVGFAGGYPLPVLRRLAAQAVALFPFLADVTVIRGYRGFRPYLPDHLPAIGPDPRVPGLYHACGHEGAGIGLAPATGALVAAQLTGRRPAVDPQPFRPERW
jgi:glycine/D-amino acid oxidase-like deaminating enzyme